MFISTVKRTPVLELHISGTGGGAGLALVMFAMMVGGVRAAVSVFCGHREGKTRTIKYLPERVFS